MFSDSQDFRLDVTDGQRRNLENWLREWELNLSLADEKSDADSCAGPQSGEIIYTEAGHGAVVELEQVRLMYPDCAATWNRPVYVAVLEAIDRERYLAAPFSRFRYPAFPGEWLTERDASQLRVLCLWNAFTIRRRRLEAGWQVDSLSPEEMKMALSIRMAIEGKASFPGDMLDRVGPMLVNPFDPRLDYREEELQMVESIMPLVEFSGLSGGYQTKEQSMKYRSKAADGDIFPE